MIFLENVQRLSSSERERVSCEALRSGNSSIPSLGLREMATTWSSSTIHIRSTPPLRPYPSEFIRARERAQTAAIYEYGIAPILAMSMSVHAAQCHRRPKTTATGRRGRQAIVTGIARAQTSLRARTRAGGTVSREGGGGGVASDVSSHTPPPPHRSPRRIRPSSEKHVRDRKSHRIEKTSKDAAAHCHRDEKIATEGDSTALVRARDSERRDTVSCAPCADGRSDTVHESDSSSNINQVIGRRRRKKSVHSRRSPEKVAPPSAPASSSNAHTVTAHTSTSGSASSSNSSSSSDSLAMPSGTPPSALSACIRCAPLPSRAQTAAAAPSSRKAMLDGTVPTPQISSSTSSLTTGAETMHTLSGTETRESALMASRRAGRRVLATRRMSASASAAAKLEGESLRREQRARRVLKCQERSMHRDEVYILNSILRESEMAMTERFLTSVRAARNPNGRSKAPPLAESQQQCVVSKSCTESHPYPLDGTREQKLSCGAQAHREEEAVANCEGRRGTPPILV